MDDPDVAEKSSAETDEMLINVLNELKSLKEFIGSSTATYKKRVGQITSDIALLRNEFLKFKEENHKCFPAISMDENDETKLLPKLPVTSPKQLEALEKNLIENQEIVKELKSVLITSAGDDCMAFLRAAVRKIITDEVAVNYTWIGTKDKIKIQNHKFLEIVREMCHYKFKDTADNKLIDEKLKKHFLHATDRLKKRLKNETCNKTKRSSRVIEECSLPELPLASTEDLDMLESRLNQSGDMIKEFKTFLLKIAEYDMASFLRTSLKKLMTDEVAYKYSWNGTKTKQRIQDYKIISLIREICHHKFKNADDEKVDNKFQAYFVHAKDRLRKVPKTEPDEEVLFADFFDVDELYFLPELPMHLAEDLEIFENNLLNSDDMLQKLRDYLLKITADEYGAFIRAALKKLMTDELANSYSWVGTRDKPRISNYKLVTAIREICNVKFKNIDHQNIDIKFNAFFAHARDRINKRLNTAPKVHKAKRPKLTNVEDRVTKRAKLKKEPTVGDYLGTGEQFDFPINDAEELKAFDNILSNNKNLLDKLKSFLLEVEVDNFPTFLRTTLKKLITDELSIKYAWLGTKEKPRIKDYQIIPLIKEVCLVKFDHAQEKSMDSILQKHFIHARDRVNKRLKNIKNESIPVDRNSKVIYEINIKFPKFQS